LAQGCRVERRDRSSAISGTPDVWPTWPQRQPVTRIRYPVASAVPCAAIQPVAAGYPHLAAPSPMMENGPQNAGYAALIGPVEEVTKKARHLLVVPSGPLTSLPCGSDWPSRAKAHCRWTSASHSRRDVLFPPSQASLPAGQLLPSDRVLFDQTQTPAPFPPPNRHAEWLPLRQ
jgi:hypothetical protein